MDAKEHIRIKTREEVSWLRLIDECSGAVLWTAVFPPRGLAKVPPEAVREQLRLALVRWGLPGRFRVDNGWPWGSRGDFPTELALWLIGLGIGMHWNNPRRPQENGVVERSQGTSTRWCEPWTCRTPAELQSRLERMDRMYREVYPYQNRRSRLEVFPGLVHSGRPYDRASETTLWKWSRVTEHLATIVPVRRVDPNWPGLALQQRPLCGQAPSRKGCLRDLRPRVQRVGVRRPRRPTTEPSASRSAQPGESDELERDSSPIEIF